MCMGGGGLVSFGGFYIGFSLEGERTNIDYFCNAQKADKYSTVDEGSTVPK